MKKFLTFVSAAAACVISLHAQTDRQPCHTVSEMTLLKELADRDEMARFPMPEYRTAQFSSYDRASVAKDQPGWYANGDWSAFIRAEEVEGHTEYVMMEDFGPGAIVRFWMTLAGGENGTVRIYLDGSEEPAIAASAMDLLGSDIIAPEPFATSVSPLTPREKRGNNLYYPIPYAKSCKVTYQKNTTGNGNVYYNIECRRYDESVQVITYKGKAVRQHAAQIRKTASALTSTPTFKNKPQLLDAVLTPGQETAINFKGTRAIEHISLKIQAEDLPQALRSTIIKIVFDGEQTVWVPIGDFFGTGYSPVHHRCFVSRAEKDGSLECYWVMPFKYNCRIAIENIGNQSISIKGEISDKKWTWDERSLHFCAAWHQLYDAKTGIEGRCVPQDVNFVQIYGKGRYVGDALTLFNTSGSWWGEGDEKIYVDGETFPSHFGTGTEDYYGYAWCEPGAFSDHPFIGLPIGKGNLGIGRSVNNRYRSLDAIPFNQSIDVNLELFEWDHERIVYAPTTFWYMRPGGKHNIAPDCMEARRKVIMEREDFLKPSLTSSIEGEDMRVESCDAQYHIQYLGHPQWSYKTILFMNKAHKGDRITASFDSPYEAIVRADAILAMAGDYGKVNLYFNGEKVIACEDLKFYEISSKAVPMGEILLKKGKNTVVIEIEDTPDGLDEGVAGIDKMIFYPL